MWALLLLMLQTGPPPQIGQRIPAPTNFVAFSADLKITSPKRPDAFGRYLQDEHGCTRRETVYPDGSPMIYINNFVTQKTYRLTTSGWVVQAMRIIEGTALPRRPRSMSVIKKVDPIEGFEVWTSTMRITNSPTGETSREILVAPALNFFEVVQKLGTETFTAHNIKVGPVDHSEFLPPPSVSPVEMQNAGGFMQFLAVDLEVSGETLPGVTLTAVEETPTPMPLTARGFEHLQLVTTIVDNERGLVRVRVMTNAKRAGPGKVTGDILDEVDVLLGSTVQTTKLPQNLTIRVLRIGMRRAK
jgi:hypothetical protein